MGIKTEVDLDFQCMECGASLDWSQRGDGRIEIELCQDCADESYRKGNEEAKEDMELNDH